MQEIFIPAERNQSPGWQPMFGRDVKAVDRIQKEERTDLLVEIPAGVPEVLKGPALTQQFLK